MWDNRNSTAGKYIHWVTIAAYKFCNIQPDQVKEITPSDLLLMLYVRILEAMPELKEKKDISKAMEPMDDETMESMIVNVLHPVITAIATQGGFND